MWEVSGPGAARTQIEMAGEKRPPPLSATVRALTGSSLHGLRHRQFALFSGLLGVAGEGEIRF